MLKTKMLFFSSVSIALLTLFSSLCTAQTEIRNSTFQIGVILDLDSLVGRIGLTSLSLALSDFYSLNRSYSSTLVLHVRDSNGQVIDAAASALNLLKDVQVDAIIGPQKSAQASFVIGLGDRANVPIISFSATSPLHPQTPYFVQTALGDAAQVGPIAALVEHFQWSQVVLIYEESDYGNGIIPYLSNAFQEINALISYRSVIPIGATDDMILKELYKMKTTQTRVFVVHMSSSLASRLFLKVKEAGMMNEGYAWIVTSEVMDLLYSMDSNVVETMEGVIGVKPLIRKSRKLRYTAQRWKRKFLNDNPDFSQAELTLYGLWAYDTLWALAMAAEKVQFREPISLGNTTVLNSTNLFTTELSQTGPKLREAISEVTFEGLAGSFHLVDGQLKPSSFQILNVVGGAERKVGIWTSSKGISSESNVKLNHSSNRKLKKILFPGDSTVVPRGWEVPVSGKKLRLGVPVESGFSEMVKVEKDPKSNGSKVSGCYIDMFGAVMAAMPYAVPYEFIPFAKLDGSSAGNYDEITYQVFLQDYDGVVGDIAITSKRSKFVDYTLPFTAGGVTMVVPTTYDNPKNKWIFWKPLTKELWLSAIGLFLFTGVALWILEHRFNNAYRGPPSQHAGMIFYFPFMSLVFAHREKIVTNLARLVVIVWVFVVLILNSTYTASLSARLTVQGLRPVITDAKELMTKGDYVGCHKGAFVCDLVHDLGFDKSMIKAYGHPEDVDDALTKGSKNGGISALFSVGPYTKLFLSTYCDKYMQVGPTYPTEGFAYAFPKGSPLVADVSRTIVELTESGRLSEIEGQWMKHQKCNGPGTTGGTSTSVSLRSFQTLFEITIGITGTCLVIFFATYMYKNRDFIHRISNSSVSFWSKVRAICKHFDQRDPKSFQSKARDSGETVTGNPCSAIVVPVSFVEMGDAPSLTGNPGSVTIVPDSFIETSDAHGDSSTELEHAASTGQQARSNVNLESIIVI